MLSWLPGNGPHETVSALQPLLDEFNPRFVGMSGICAGDKRDVKLGDLIVADRAFNIDSGKIVKGPGDTTRREYDTYTASSARVLIQYAQRFTQWQTSAENLKRPISKHQQRDWLLVQLVNNTPPRIDAIDSVERGKHAPLWKKIMAELQAEPDPWLSSARELINPARVHELSYGTEDFPYQDPATPTCHIKPMGSSNAVQAANPFDEIRIPVRVAVAVDMEGAAFYRLLEGFPSIRSLLVKGVCNYADSEKDDTYQEYAAQLSATYMLSFIQTYVTQKLMPSPSGAPANVQQKQPEPVVSPTTIPLDEDNTVDAPDALNVFFSYAPADDTYREGLEKQLVVLKYQGRIKWWYSGNVTGGKDQGVESLRHLNEAQIILLLVSPDFMSSRFFSQELKQAEARYKAGKARVIPILLRPTEGWSETRPFGNLVPLPKDGRPIEAWSRRDQALYEVAKGIREVVDELDGKGKKKS